MPSLPLAGLKSNMDYNIYFDLAGLVLLITILVHFFIKKSISTPQTRMFLVLTAVGTIATVSDILTVCLYRWLLSYPPIFNYLLNVVYLVSFNLLGTGYLYYMCLIAADGSKVRRLWKNLVYIPAIVDSALIISSPLTKLIFYFDESMVYHQGPLMPLLYLVAGYYLVGCIILATKYHRVIARQQKIAVYFFNISMLLAIFLQMFVIKDVMISEFAAATSILMIYLSLEDPDDYSDKHLGIYNRNAFVKVVNDLVSKEESFNVLGIRVNEFKYINDTIGVKNANVFLEHVISELKKYTGASQLFRISGLRFAILSKSDDELWYERVAAISARLERPFKSPELESSLSTLMCSMNYPDNVHSSDEILEILEYYLEETRDQGKGEVVVVDKKILGFKHRETSLLLILRSALEKGEFEVYYQPIYSVEKQRFTSAEALLRLNNFDLGYISPEEFIPLAEKNGLILDIGEFVFRDVCKFIAKERLADAGIEYIEINLSVVQCMQERMHEVLTEIMEQYKVEASFIDLEITETSAVVSSETLRRNMAHLTDTGVTFALDDFGTGYSNLTTVTSYPFSIIKLDKSMVWGAFEESKPYWALKYTVNMIKHMGLKIVAEGVETFEQAQELADMGCDYFQGYYYSKAIPAQDFVELLHQDAPTQ